MIFSPSGGGLYHWRALTRRNLWQPFTSQLEQWLESWALGPEKLLLIGPSGGHTLPSRWLEKFAQVTAVDIDPVAGPLFRLRHRRANLNFNREDVFFKNGRLSVEPLREFLANHQGTPVLFCNVLGQLPLEKQCTEEEWLSFLSALPGLLAGSPWASYHDTYTLEGLPVALHEKIARPYLNGATMEDAAAQLEDRSALIIDHMTSGAWAGSAAKARWAWSLTPTSLHLLEGIRSRP